MGFQLIRSLESGGTITGDLSVTGDLSIGGSVTSVVDLTLTGIVEIDTNSATALVIKNSTADNVTFSTAGTNPILTINNNADQWGNPLLCLQAGATVDQARYIGCKQYDGDLCGFIGWSETDEFLVYSHGDACHTLWHRTSTNGGTGSGNFWMNATGTGAVMLGYENAGSPGSGGLHVYNGEITAGARGQYGALISGVLRLNDTNVGAANLKAAEFTSDASKGTMTIYKGGVATGSWTDTGITVMESDQGNTAFNVIAGATSANLNVYSNGTPIFTITGSAATAYFGGRFGVGATPPKYWHSSLTAINLGGLAFLEANAAAATGQSLRLSQNAYFLTGWARVIEDECSQYEQKDGTHIFHVAGSDVADSAITWVTALTIAVDGDVTGGATGPTWKIQRETATATNPVFNPGGADTYGIGGTATTTTMVANSLNRFEADGTGIGFFATTPAAQPAHLADPTDLATCITAITQLIDNEKVLGLMAADP